MNKGTLSKKIYMYKILLCAHCLVIVFIVCLVALVGSLWFLPPLVAQLMSLISLVVMASILLVWVFLSLVLARCASRFVTGGGGCARVWCENSQIDRPACDCRVQPSTKTRALVVG